MVEIAARPPVRVCHDRLPAHLMKGDILRGMPRRRRDRHGAEHPLRKGRSPLQDLHAAHRAAGDAEQLVNAEMVHQHGLGAHHVGNGHHRQVEPPGLARFRIDRGGTGAAHAAADHIRADDEIAVGIDRLAGTDHGLPPAGLAGDRMHIGHVLVARQGMADQHRIGLRRVQRSVGLVGDGERRQVDAGIHFQGLVGPEMRDGALGRIHFPQAKIVGRGN